MVLFTGNLKNGDIMGAKVRDEKVSSFGGALDGSNSQGGITSKSLLRDVAAPRYPPTPIGRTKQNTQPGL